MVRNARKHYLYYQSNSNILKGKKRAYRAAKRSKAEKSTFEKLSIAREEEEQDQQEPEEPKRRAVRRK